MSKEFVRFDADFSGLAEFIGSAEGWSTEVKTPYYISELLQAAHGATTKDFDREAAQVAKALGFTHMYEWGTIGVTRGQGHLNPTTRAAKLWVHRLTGHGSNRKIDFGFRPSVEPVPQEDIGGTHPLERKHVFHNKAMIAEYGVPVVIKPKWASVLVIPLNENALPRRIKGSKK